MNALNIVKRMQVLLPLIPTLALALPAWAGIPGSVIVFPKFIQGTVIVDGVPTPRTEITLRAVCPFDITCAEGQQMQVKAKWVCEGSQSAEGGAVCRGTGFDLTLTINGTVAFDPDNSPIPGSDPVAVPMPDCRRGFLIMWAVDDSGRPIKFDALGGVAALRESGSAASGYTAPLINADPKLTSGDLISLGPDGALVFDGGSQHYQTLESKITGELRFTRTTTTEPAPPDGYPTASITLLTLDVRVNQPNNPTFVPLDFFNATGQRTSTSTAFVCWTEQPVDTINPSLTFESMRTRGGFVLGGPAEKIPVDGTADSTGPATLMGLIEITEGPTPGSAEREAIIPLTPNAPLVTTSFTP
jgi:hypothetical protein